MRILQRQNYKKGMQTNNKVTVKECMPTDTFRFMRANVDYFNWWK